MTQETIALTIGFNRILEVLKETIQQFLERVDR